MRGGQVAAVPAWAAPPPAAPLAEEIHALRSNVPSGGLARGRAGPSRSGESGLWPPACEQGRGAAGSLPEARGRRAVHRCRRAGRRIDRSRRDRSLLHGAYSHIGCPGAVCAKPPRRDDQRGSAEKSASAMASTRACISSRTLSSCASRSSTPRVTRWPCRSVSRNHGMNLDARPTLCESTQSGVEVGLTGCHGRATARRLIRSNRSRGGGLGRPSILAVGLCHASQA